MASRGSRSITVRSPPSRAHKAFCDGLERFILCAPLLFWLNPASSFSNIKFTIAVDEVFPNQSPGPPGLKRVKPSTQQHSLKFHGQFGVFILGLMT